MCLSPFLKTGTIQAYLKSDGTCPVSNEVWNILASIGASSSAAALRINAGIESGRFQSVEKFVNSFLVDFYVGHARIWAWAFVWEAGIFFREDRHKLVVKDVGFAGTVTLEETVLVLSGETPVASCPVFFTNDQNLWFNYYYIKYDLEDY